MKKILLIILLAIFPFGQLLRWDLGGGITLHLNDVVVGIIGSWGIFQLVRGLVSKKGDLLEKAVALWAAAMVLSLLINFKSYPARELLAASLYAVRWLAYAGLFFALRDMRDKKILSGGMIMASTVVAAAGLFQYIFMPDVSFLSAQNWDNHYFRLVSTFLDPGFTGMVLALGLLLVFFQSGNGLLLTVIFTALAFTYSRASYLAYLIVFAAAAFYKRSLRIIVAAILILAVAVYFLPQTAGEGTKLERENSSWARVVSWQIAVTTWKKAPVFGVGFDAYRYATRNTETSHAGAGSDSSLLTVFATTGIVGLIAYLGVLWGMWSAGRKSFLFKASFLAVFVHSWFNNTLLYTWVMEWLWLLLIMVKSPDAQGNLRRRI